jgi:branched-chain amino acid transport system substrate-binding protein
VRILDSAAGAAGWTPARAAANARTATRDSSAIAYLGEFESGATRASLPITNEARLLQVSAASGADDLAAPFPGSPEVPDLQPTGERTFGRVIPADAVQARAAVGWADELGWNGVRVRTDGSEFGDALASAFREGARKSGLEPGGDAAYLAGYPSGFEGQADDPVLGGKPQQLASDAFLGPAGDGVGALADSAYVTSAALDPVHLPPQGREFAARFEDEYGRQPGRYAAYGYEAMASVLGAIDGASDAAERSSVTDAFFSTESRDSVLGQYSITETGDTTLASLSGYEVRGGKARPTAELTPP